MVSREDQGRLGVPRERLLDAHLAREGEATPSGVVHEGAELAFRATDSLAEIEEILVDIGLLALRFDEQASLLVEQGGHTRRQPPPERPRQGPGLETHGHATSLPCARRRGASRVVADAGNGLTAARGGHKLADAPGFASGPIFDRAAMELPDDLQFMDQALAMAQQAAALGEVPVAALVVCDGRILAAAHNRRELDRDPTAHAEMLAIREAARVLGDWRLDGCTVYVTLEPCAMCAGAMVLARVARCVYGCTDPKGGFLGTLGDLSKVAGLNHRYSVVSGVRQEASAALLKAFFRRLRGRGA